MKYWQETNKLEQKNRWLLSPSLFSFRSFLSFFSSILFFFSWAKTHHCFLLDSFSSFVLRLYTLIKKKKKGRKKAFQRRLPWASQVRTSWRSWKLGVSWCWLREVALDGRKGPIELKWPWISCNEEARLGRPESIGGFADRCSPNEGRVTACHDGWDSRRSAFRARMNLCDLVLEGLKVFVKVNGDGDPV